MPTWVNGVVALAMAAISAFLGTIPGNFYAGRLGGPPRGKPIPGWFGRLWFYSFSVGCLYMSYRNFVHQ